MNGNAKTVTFQVNKECYSGGNRINIEVGQKIKAGKNMWRISYQRIKNKEMIHRLLKKEYYPYLLVTSVNNADYQSTTLTVKPYNF